MPDELWNEVRDIVRETGIKTIPMEKKYRKAKWLSEEALQIAEKRREAKNKEKEGDTHLDAGKTFFAYGSSVPVRVEHESGTPSWLVGTPAAPSVQ